MRISDHINSSLKLQLQTVKDLLHHYTNRAYIVGGAVRDSFLGREIKDLDIEVYDVDEENFSFLMQKLGAKGVGKSFFVYKYKDIDLSLPRVEKKCGVGHKAFEVKRCNDEKEASKRRDFTMNAMMVNFFDGTLLDFWGGVESINSKEIRVIDEKSFKEDSLRVLRALQFSSRFGFKIEQKSLEIMDLIELDDLSKDRVFWEFEKLFNSTFLHYGLYYILKLKIESKLFGIKSRSDVFLKSAKELKRSVRNFEKELYPYYFIYIWGGFFGFEPLVLLDRLFAPKHYIRALKNQPFIDGYIDDAKLKEIAINLPIKMWLGNYKEGIKQRAKELGIWERKYDGGVKIAQIIKEGYKDKDIRLEFERRVLESIREY